MRSVTAVARISSLRIVPVSFRQACKFVAHMHRHLGAPRGHKFSIAVADEAGRIRGVAMVGRTVARHFDDGWTLEVNRTCTEPHRQFHALRSRQAGRAGARLPAPAHVHAARRIGRFTEGRRVDGRGDQAATPGVGLARPPALNAEPLGGTSPLVRATALTPFAQGQRLRSETWQTR